MNPQDLTGRDLDLAVAKALGWTSLRYERIPTGYRSGITGGGGMPEALTEYLLGHPPDGSSPPPLIRHVPRYAEDGDRIPELFADVCKRSVSDVGLTQIHVAGKASVFVAATNHRGNRVWREGSTPNEALARLLLMVACHVP